MSESVNADPAELAKFSELAHRWWDPDSEFRPLHQINPLRLDWINQLSPLEGQRVLDVGGHQVVETALAFFDQHKAAQHLLRELPPQNIAPCVRLCHRIRAGPI